MLSGHFLRTLKASFVVCALTLALLSPGQVHAAGTAVVSVIVSTTTVNPGQQFTVDISVNPNNAIAGAQFSLSFNPSLVSVDNVAEGDLLKGGGASTYFMPGQINDPGGALSAVAAAIISPGQTVSTAGTFAVITMTAKNTGGTCPLNLSSVIVGDVNGQAIPVDVVGGQVVVSGTNSAPDVKNEQPAVVSWYVLALIIMAMGVAAAATTVLILRRRQALVKTWMGDTDSSSK